MGSEWNLFFPGFLSRRPAPEPLAGDTKQTREGLFSLAMRIAGDPREVPASARDRASRMMFAASLRALWR